MASLAGGMAAYADEGQPTAQALETPTVAVEAQPTEALPTEALPTEPTVENIPTGLPTFQVPPTETFRVIEIRTRVATHAPTFVPTAIPTAAQPTLDPDPIAAATADTGLPAALTVEPTAAFVDGSATAAINELTPLPFSTDTTTSIVTETITPAIIGSPTGTPGWVPPGPECNLIQSEIVVKLDVPYIHQVLDIGVADGNWACGPTSITMILAYYGKLDPWQEYLARQAANYTATPASIAGTTSIATPSIPTSTPTALRLTNTSTPTARSVRTVRSVASGTAKTTPTTVRRAGLSFAPYVTNAYSNNGYIYDSTSLDPRGSEVAGLYGTICPTGFADWSRMRFVLEQHGLSSRHISVSWDGVVAALKLGHPVIIGTDLTPVGHILVVVGYTENGQIIVNDPYGNRFAPGYGGTMGEGLLYPWNCSMVRNAVEVIGEYPPPGNTPSPATSFASYGGRTYYMAEDHEPAVPLRASAPLMPTPSAEKSTSVPTAKSTAKPAAKVVPGVAVASAATGDKLDGAERHAFGWGLFSMLGVAVAMVGVRGFRKTRRAVAEAGPAPPITGTLEYPGSAITLEAEEHDVVAASGIESAEQAAGHAASEPKRSLISTPSSGLQLVLRRTLPLALPLFLLGLKLYQTSKGQKDARTRITDETKQFMIRNL